LRGGMKVKTVCACRVRKTNTKTKPMLRVLALPSD